MARRNIHVYLGPAPTRDGDGEGHWVTIHGAHVQIGQDGKITKGPAGLVGKSEHEAHADGHADKASAHRIAAKAKREEGDHATAQHHEFAAAAHANAEQAYKALHQRAETGDVKAARKYHEDATKQAAAAETHEVKAYGKDQGSAMPKKFVKPKAHEGLHADAAEDVKGSEKHAAEHKRLMGLYDSSKHDWERNAVNRLIGNNAAAGAQHNAQTAHNVALAHSEHAKASEDVLAHRQAQESIKRAIDQHGKAGGAGYTVKQKELQERLKSHDKFVAKADKASGETGRAGSKDTPHGDMHPNGTPYSTPGGKKITRPASATPADDKKRAAVHARSGHSTGKSGLDMIAERVAKKATEGGADQDPKHKA